jgi:septal ring factor EnvC (AmiA/AmiB activator)
VTTPLERKVRQLDNDVQAIYEMIATVEATQRRHGNRLEEITATQSEHGRILTEHSAVLAEHSAVLAEHSVVLADHTTKLDRIVELLERR